MLQSIRHVVKRPSRRADQMYVLNSSLIAAVTYSDQRQGVTHIEKGVSDAPLRAVFVEMKQPGPYGTDAASGDAPVFAGDGAAQKLDNDRATVWEYARMPAAQRHRHTHDAVVVAIGGQTERVTWVGRGTVHGEEAVGNASRVYMFEIK